MNEPDLRRSCARERGEPMCVRYGSPSTAPCMAIEQEAVDLHQPVNPAVISAA
jgi:hypothetical protein